MEGDADIAAVAAVFADGTRARIAMRLADGRALPASTLAADAGVAASTASEHLRRLVDAGLVTAHPQGRHRYFRLAGPHVGELIEALARVAPAGRISSLRQANRSEALREARTCYDHLAGRLGVRIFTSLLDDGSVTGGDGVHRLDGEGADRLSSPGRDIAYRLSTRGHDRLERLGVTMPPPESDGMIPLRYCVDWTEQRHHLSGIVGRALLARLIELGWLTRDRSSRAVRVAEDARGLRRAFGDAVMA